jgi:uncharacterized YccA/Bax inhibitor family protein
MNIGRTANPTLNTKAFQERTVSAQAGAMTVQGTINKTFLLLLLILAAAAYTWNQFYSAPDPATGASIVTKWMLIGGIGGFVAALVTVFKKTWANITTPIYAVLEGLFLGGISAYFEAQFQGIVIQAVGLTFGTLFAMLFAYKTGMIKVTKKFRMGVVAATGGIFIMYLVSFVLSLFGVNVGFLHNSSILSIIISLVVIIIAAMNLVLDFDLIDRGAQANAPKYMEWYAAFGLMVTLVWLYIEFLRLLSKISSRN